MGGRTKPNWRVFEGGPLDGHHVLMPERVQATYTHYAYSSPGRRTPHEYAVTGERRAMTPWKQQVPVFRFVRALPEEPAPPTTWEEPGPPVPLSG